MTPRRPNLATTVSIVVAASLASGATADRELHRRDGAAPLVVERVAATGAGVQATVRSEGLRFERLVPWDRVASIDLDEAGGLEAGIARGIEKGTLVWRGRTRLNRGDAVLARAAFESAFDAGVLPTSELGGIALEGVVRAAIAAGDTSPALGEAVLVSEFSPGLVEPSRFPRGAVLIDPDTGLVASVPPVGEDADRSRMLDWFRRVPAPDARAALRRTLFVRLLEGTGPPDESGQDLSDGERFLLRLTELDAEDAGRRERTRRTLLAAAADAPVWKTAWIRFFAGRGTLARETDPELRMRGVLDLVEVIALESSAPPVLRRASLRLAAAALRDLGRSESAAILESFLIAERADDALPENLP